MQAQEARIVALQIINVLADAGAKTSDAKKIFEICNDYLSAIPIPHLQRKDDGA